MFTADGVLTIYSLGDSIFLSNVLNGIAMITTGGDSSTDRGSFLYITAIGALVGIFLTALRGLQTGKAFDLNSLMLCIIAWYFFFGWNVSVSIRDVFHNEDRLVAHVPGGVALTGSAISSLGWGLTSIYEQAFLPVTAEGGISKGLAQGAPFADTAKTLNALTALGGNPALISALDAGKSKQSDNRTGMRENIINYINECTMKAVNLGYKNLSDVFNMTVVPEGSSSGSNSSGSGPVEETSALSFNNGGNIYMTSYNGDTVNCSTALNRMNTDLDSALKSTSVKAIIAANTVDPTQKQTSGVSTFSLSRSSSDDSAYALRKIDDVMGILGKDADTAQNMIKASIYYHVFPLGAASNALSAGDRATATMLEQARMQRNTQWSGEGTMFQQTMIPIMTFIEGFTYAVTPFMGLFLLLGMFGVSLSIKYFMLVAWVQSWMPCLAIANNYIDSSLQRAISDFGMYTANNATQGRLDSFEGVMRVMDIAQNHLATAGMFIGAIPIITLFIFSGSIYALSSLTSRMNGAEFINQRIPTPDMLSPAAVMSMMSQQNGLNGMVNANGAPWEMISFNTQAATERGLAFKNLNSIQNSLSTAAQKAGSTVFSSNSQTSIADVWSYGNSSNYSDNRQISDQISKAIADKTGWEVGSAENNQATSEFSIASSIKGALAKFGLSSSQDISWKDVKSGLNQQQQQLVDSGAYSADYTSAFGSMLNENNSVSSGKTVDASTVQSINEGAQKLGSASKELTRTSKLAQTSQLTQAVSLDQLLYQSNNNKEIRSKANDFYQKADKSVKQSIDALANKIDSENKTSDPRLAATLSYMSKTDEGRQAIGEAVWGSKSTLNDFVDPNDPNNTSDLPNKEQLEATLNKQKRNANNTYTANKAKAKGGIKVSSEKDVRDLNKINTDLVLEGHFGEGGTKERAHTNSKNDFLSQQVGEIEDRFHKDMESLISRKGTWSSVKAIFSESAIYKNLDTNTNMYKKDKDGRITREGYEEKLDQAVATTADNMLLKEEYKDVNGKLVETQASKDSRELFKAVSKSAYINGVGESGGSIPRMDLTKTEEIEMQRDAQIALDNARAKWKESHPTATDNDLWALEHLAVGSSIYNLQSSDDNKNTANSFNIADRIGTAHAYLDNGNKENKEVKKNKE